MIVSDKENIQIFLSHDKNAGHVFNDLMLSQVIELDKKFFPTPWSDISWRKLNLANENLLVLSIKDQEIVGFLLFSISALEELGHLVKIVVHPSRRKMGIAKRMFLVGIQNLSKNHIGRCYLEVDAENSDAILLYKSIGFYQLAKIKGFYSYGGDALTMEYIIPVGK